MCISRPGGAKKTTPVRLGYLQRQEYIVLRAIW